MLQFVVNDGPGEVRTVLCSQFPFLIGRSPDAALQLPAQGVWDHHAQVTHDPLSGQVFMHPLGEAFFLINGTRCDARALAPGDEIQIGAVKLTVSLSPVIQKRLSVAELPLWLILSFAVLVEIGLLIALK
jgi:pSer/pThr/pTyr-binding forkhead associated (FHA) protein